MRCQTLPLLGGRGFYGARLEYVVEGEVQEAEGCELGKAGGDLLEVVLGEIQRGEPGQAVQRRQVHALIPGRAGQRHPLHNTRPGVSARESRGLLLGRGGGTRSAWASAWAC